MSGAPCFTHHDAMEPDVSPDTASLLSPRDASHELVHLTRFRVGSDQRPDVVRVARSTASRARLADGVVWQLLVELEDGDWLDISITGPGVVEAEDAAYLTLAEGIVGEESGTVVAIAVSDHRFK